MASDDGIRSLVPDIVRYAPSWKDGTIERIREMTAAGIRMTHPFLSDFAGAGTFSTAGLADDERHHCIGVIELLKNRGFQIRKFHMSFAFL